MKDLHEYVKHMRRVLHQIPEMGLEEFQTSLVIQEELTKMGLPFEGVDKTGVVAMIKGCVGEKTWAFRADMDALPILENSDYPYPSKHTGFMHACGHDTHMAMLLGFAKHVCENQHLLKDNVLLIFQPAEEGPGGAERIVQLGILEKYQVNGIFGLHVFPEIEQGVLACRPGALMAMVGEFDIHIKAKGAHGAMPHTGIDGLVIASECLLGLQTILSRNISPIHPAVLTVGKLNGGERRNIIAEHVTLEGTLRAFDKDVYKTLKHRLQQYVKGLAAAYGVEIACEVRDAYPPVVNNEALYKQFSKAFKDAILIDPQMISEDFSYYQEAVPGLFYFLGTKNEKDGYVYPLHHSRFNVNDDVLIEGVQSFLTLLKSFGGMNGQ